MQFKNELEFEKVIIEKLTKDMGQWNSNILEFKNENELISNWKNIIQSNNNQTDRLNNHPLNDDEMHQIVSYFDRTLKTPYEINKFLNGDPSISIIRTNQDDKDHYGKRISLVLFNKKHKAGGTTIYQIARQVKFKSNYSFKDGNRSDITLLINGMPLIHVELKNDSLNSDKLKEGINQIKRYKHENAFVGIFSLIQLFVVMTPSEMKYFANVESYELFNDKLIFQWADENNNYIEDWRDVCNKFLSIPMAHDLISFYSVADESDKTLKILRSYQCHAVNKIFNIVLKKDWTDTNLRGGYIYHTTGSGKTLTCFKVAQLLESLTSVDKILFLLDAVQLYEQTYKNFQAFSGLENIEDTKNTDELAKLLKSNDKSEKIIVTSIQKMSEITNINNESNKYERMIDDIKSKKIVFVLDEAHRTTNGKMLADIKNTYKNSLFFGFTGTPIFEKNAGDRLTTVGLFGDELHRYTMLSAINDGNVLEVKNDNNLTTYNVEDMKEKIAKSRFEPNSNEYFNFINNTSQLELEEESCSALRDYYDSDIHKKIVVDDILKNFNNRSHNKFFHHILATTNITNAINYYRLFKSIPNDLNIAITFDSNETNDDNSIFKNDAIEEILKDYRNKFNKKNVNDFKSMKKDIVYKLQNDLDRNKSVDLVIVVDQLLTGFDSKYINFVYLDKVMQYERLIQTVSRTNRILSNKNENIKNYGYIRCYQKTEIMKRNLQEAAELFISPNNTNFFESKLKENLLNINKSYEEITNLFNQSNILNFYKLPKEKEKQSEFGNWFSLLKNSIDKSIPELFNWKDKIYYFTSKDDFVEIKISEKNFNILLQRYNELPKEEKEKHNIYINVEQGTFFTSGYNLDKNNLSSLVISFGNDNSNKNLDRIKKEIAVLDYNNQNIVYELLDKIKNKSFNIDKNFNIDTYLFDYKKDLHNELINELHEFGVSKDLVCWLCNKNIKTIPELTKLNEFDELMKNIDKNLAQLKISEILEYQIEPRSVYNIMDQYLKEFLIDNKVSIIKWLKTNIKQ